MIDVLQRVGHTLDSGVQAGADTARVIGCLERTVEHELRSIRDRWEKSS